jgi:hypothetical protein
VTVGLEGEAEIAGTRVAADDRQLEIANGMPSGCEVRSLSAASGVSGDERTERKHVTLAVRAQRIITTKAKGSSHQDTAFSNEDEGCPGGWISPLGIGAILHCGKHRLT